MKRIVYRIGCKDCPQVYKGQSGPLQTWNEERERAVFHGDTNSSALAEHALRYGLERDWKNANIIDLL